jgi:integrase
MAGMKGKVFHMLRHGCASTLAAAGASQAQLMAHMGHASLASSRRYLHADVANKRALAQRVFG